MHFATLWRWLLIACLSVLMVACKPQASFLVTPNPATVGVAASFDASATLITSTSKKAPSYAWNFGDGSTGTGQIAQHSYAAAGTYTVTLTVKDGDGKVGVSTQQLTVQAASAPSTASLSVTVKGADGTLLPGASVSLGDTASLSGNDGLATVASVPVGSEQVLRISLAGYVPQVLRTTVSAGQTSARLLAVLQPVGEVLTLADAATAETLQTTTLGARLSLPAAGFVNAAGQVATGALTARVTAWDLGSDTLAGLPGNGRARQADGTIVQLVNAGVLSASFEDASGNALQLASGQTADIQVDLATASVNGQTLAAGSSVPLWHFDEAQGYWVPEGSGTVVVSYSSPVGLAVKATVSHFSSWAWSFGLSMPRKITLYCADAAGTHVDCEVSAVVRLPDNARHAVSTAVPAAGIEIDAPDFMSVIWSATAAPDLVGQLTTSSTAATAITVTIPLEVATTANLVSCKLPDGTGVPCQVTVSGSSDASRTVFVPAGGALVRTSMGSSTLYWQGVSLPYIAASGTAVISSGTNSSTVSGNVLLTLATDSDGRRKRLYLRCDEAVTLDTGPATLATCDIDAKYLADVAVDPVHYRFTQVPAGTAVALYIPWQSHIFGGMYSSFRVDATGVTTTGEAVRTSYSPYMSGDHYYPGNLVNDQVLTSRLLGLSIAGY